MINRYCISFDIFNARNRHLPIEISRKTRPEFCNFAIFDENHDREARSWPVHFDFRKNIQIV